jgi:PPOX class probable F420-dependent enzyme
VTTYPQAPAMTEDEVVAFLQEAPVARLCSHNEDGTIHVAPAWFEYRDGQILIGTQKISRKARNVQRDGRVSVMVDTETPPYKGLLIYGTAEWDDEEAIAKRAAIFSRHMPPERAERMAKGMASRFEPVIIRVRPERIVSYDYAK